MKTSRGKEIVGESATFTGPTSFVETAGGFEDYATAIKRKMLRELVPAVAALDQG